MNKEEMHLPRCSKFFIDRVNSVDTGKTYTRHYYLVIPTLHHNYEMQPIMSACLPMRCALRGGRQGTPLMAPSLLNAISKAQKEEEVDYVFFSFVFLSALRAFVAKRAGSSYLPSLFNLKN
jgi:hypothetical protein